MLCLFTKRDGQIGGRREHPQPLFSRWQPDP